VKAHPPSHDHRESILLLPQVETMLGRGPKTLRIYVEQGLLPRPRQIGLSVFWLASEIEAAFLSAPLAERWMGPCTAVQPMEVEAA